MNGISHPGNLHRFQEVSIMTILIKYLRGSFVLVIAWDTVFRISLGIGITYPGRSDSLDVPALGMSDIWQEIRSHQAYAVYYLLLSGQGGLWR